MNRSPARLARVTRHFLVLVFRPRRPAGGTHSFRERPSRRRSGARPGSAGRGRAAPARLHRARKSGRLSFACRLLHSRLRIFARAAARTLVRQRRARAQLREAAAETGQARALFRAAPDRGQEAAGDGSLCDSAGRRALPPGDGRRPRCVGAAPDFRRDARARAPAEAARRGRSVRTARSPSRQRPREALRRRAGRLRHQSATRDGRRRLSGAARRPRIHCGLQLVAP